MSKIFGTVIQGYKPLKSFNYAPPNIRQSSTKVHPKNVNLFAVITPKKPTPDLYPSRESHTPWSIDLDPAAFPVNHGPTMTQSNMSITDMI